jgi:hypothetical protein
VAIIIIIITVVKMRLGINGASPPKMDHLNPSITHTIGFKEYIILHSSGITLLEKPTGDTYKPN